MEMERAAVVGAGMMGSEIALVLALAGHEVLLTDQSPDYVGTALAKLGQTVERLAGRGFLVEAEGRAALDRISPSTIEGFGDRQIVIEAIFEDIEAKSNVFRRLDAVLPKDAVLTSNTSSISITALSGALSEERRPHFLGTHFFSPVSRMKLVEVVSAMDSDPAVVERVFALMQAIGKEPVRVQDVVGFAINRALHAFFIESIRLVEEGVISAEDMDRACKAGLGHPVGPFELMDATKNDLGLQVQGILLENYGERFRSPSLLRTMVTAGYNGRAAGRGWYRYRGGRRVTERSS